MAEVLIASEDVKVSKFNLNRATSLGAFLRMSGEERTTFFYEKCDFDQLVVHGNHSPLTFSNLGIYSSSSERSIVVKGKRVISLPYFDYEEDSGVEECSRDLRGIHRQGDVGVYFAAVLIECKVRHEQTVHYAQMILLNADDEGNSAYLPLVAELGDRGFPIVSFECLDQMFGHMKSVSWLVSERLSLLDYNPESRISLSDKELELLKKKDTAVKLKPPHPGYSLVGGDWHRSGGCLFKDNQTSKCYLFGQDDGTYFGCELSKTVATINEAFDSLIPDEVRGKSYSRQGEWFIIEVSEKKLPRKEDRVANFKAGTTSEVVYLPVESEESNPHYINCTEGFAATNGQIYACHPRLLHADHPTVTKDGWCTFYRNTAVRSVSQEGVD
jgi:hypothetical protein